MLMPPQRTSPTIDIETPQMHPEDMLGNRERILPRALSGFDASPDKPKTYFNGSTDGGFVRVTVPAVHDDTTGF